jgi:molecular chaperone IbpA
MKVHDLSPLFQASTDPGTGKANFENALRPDSLGGGYPPYNIEKLGNHLYRLTLAVAGFSESDLTLSLQCNTLIICGKHHKAYEPVEYLYRGIAGRAFERHFQLGDFIHIVKAVLENGLLMIFLERILPEALKPKRIAIETRYVSDRLIEQKPEDFHE